MGGRVGLRPIGIPRFESRHGSERVPARWRLSIVPYATAGAAQACFTGGHSVR